jgi:pimeloyl-ACP methyl ester carboxylesterase
LDEAVRALPPDQPASNSQTVPKPAADSAPESEPQSDPDATPSLTPNAAPSLTPNAATDPAQETVADSTAVSGATASGNQSEQPKTVLLLHGWGGWRGQVAAFVEPLTEAGFTVVAVDALAHGDSGPGEHGSKHSSGGELMRSFEALVAEIGQPYGVIAHSLGCAAACRMVLNGTLEVDRLVLVSPSPDMREVAKTFADRLGFKQRPHRMLVEAMERRAKGKLADFDIADMGATGLLPDALVIHDAVDKESPYGVSQGIAARWTGVKLITTRGLGHHRILIKPAVVARAAAHIVG